MTHNNELHTKGGTMTPMTHYEAYLSKQLEAARHGLTSDGEVIEQLKALCARAADALDIMTQLLLISDVPLEWEENKRRDNTKLIAELRKAAE